MSSRGKCLECGGKRDRGPYTKFCSSCFIQPCNRCGEPNLRGPMTTLCSKCKNLPPVIDKAVCRRCQGKNDRGGRATICSKCFATDPKKARKELTIFMNLEAKPGEKWCPECETYRTYDKFYTSSRKVVESCNYCTAEMNSTRALDKYGLTDDDYIQLFEAQGRVCAICKSAPREKKLHVDHDHKTGLIRGLLCIWCNHKVLGGAKENSDILRKAADYLDAPPAIEYIGARYADIDKAKVKRNK